MPGITKATPVNFVGYGIIVVIRATTTGIDHICNAGGQWRPGVLARAKILIYHRVAQAAIAGLSLRVNSQCGERYYGK
jgi:hypothetical protein